MVATSNADQPTSLAVESRRRLVVALRLTDEPLDVQHLAAMIGLHATTVRFHLDVLEQAALIRRTGPPQSRAREPAGPAGAAVRSGGATGGRGGAPAARAGPRRRIGCRCEQRRAAHRAGGAVVGQNSWCRAMQAPGPGSRAPVRSKPCTAREWRESVTRDCAQLSNPSLLSRHHAAEAGELVV